MWEDARLLIGEREQWGKMTPFGLSPADLRHHLYVIGKSGSGKTTLLRNLILQDIDAGRGVAVIDPHGDLSQELLALIPGLHVGKTLYLDPADADFPISFNVLRSPYPKHLVASGIVGAMKGIWRESWGPRLEYILYAAIAALLDCQNVTMLGLQRMLSDARYRAWVVKQAKDPIVRSFWKDEFDNYDRRFAQEAIAPIQNKVGQLLMSPLIRNVLGQVRNSIDARFMMDNGRIFLANLAKGRMGEEQSNLLGALLISQFQLAAMSRADIPEAERRDFRLYVDEFQSFTSQSFKAILSEARKYRLSLTLSHQYIEQVPPDIRSAVFGNVGSVISFRIGHADAEVLEREFGRSYHAGQFASLNNHEVYARLLEGGQQREPFLGRTLAPVTRGRSHAEAIMLRSRQKYGERREVIEQRIQRWLGRFPY
jgi:GTPase SAR1 family protein